MPTYRVDLAYDGSGFRGYAAQRGQRTVQGELEQALSVLLGSHFETAVAGRTDAGVHAHGQVMSIVAEQPIDADATLRSLNGILAPEIAVNRIQPAADGFHARFSAKWRRYRYLLDCGRAADPLSRHMAWHVGPGIDMDRVRAATRSLGGEHDFSS
ncbi:MAG: tRNA pseudouridine(38-40) synthase TruA, partial [Actinobacteria bacterium]|nr:tRNA pseudouridine(38-40) synthase TruA [Actinomycetota bacterium]